MDLSQRAYFNCESSFLDKWKHQFPRSQMNERCAFQPCKVAPNKCLSGILITKNKTTKEQICSCSHYFKPYLENITKK